MTKTKVYLPILLSEFVKKNSHEARPNMPQRRYLCARHNDQCDTVHSTWDGEKFEHINITHVFEWVEVYTPAEHLSELIKVGSGMKDVIQYCYNRMCAGNITEEDINYVKQQLSKYQ